LPHSISLAEVVTAEAPQLHRPTFARISQSALKHNFDCFRKLAGDAKLMAVVKADAYGHGMVNCARLFSELGADYLGVAFVEEGIALRRSGYTEPVLVLGGIVGSQIALYLEYDLEMTASSVFKLEAINQQAWAAQKPARVHLKIDTGLNRIGQNFRTADRLFETAKRCTHVEVIGIYSHLATAEQQDTEFAKLQTQRFREVVDLGRLYGFHDATAHLANSAAVIQLPDSRFDMIRPGLGLYGLQASPHLQNLCELQPAMTLCSEIVYLKTVRKGEGISYGLTWTAPRTTWIATIAIGYGDGYPRHLSNKAHVLIGGKRYPVVGSVCMDQVMVDLGDDQANVGDEVVLWGRQGEAEITLTELSEQGGFIPYELPIYLTGRVPRVLST